jgi:hypothetical protein
MSFTNTAPRPGMLMKSHQPHSHWSPFNANNDTNIEIQTMILALFALKEKRSSPFNANNLVFVYFCIRSLSIHVCASVCSTNTNVKTVRKIHLHDPKVHWRESGALENQELECVRMTTITLLLVRFTEGGKEDSAREKRENLALCKSSAE